MSDGQQVWMDNGSSRRRFLATCGLAAGAAFLTPKPSNAEAPLTDNSFGFNRYSDLLDAIRKRGHEWRTLGHCPDGSPVVAVKAGGEKLPAILISAGAHSTEHAGVVAAVELIDELRTDHAVYVIPCRDPMGLQGFRHVLSFGLGEELAIAGIDEVEPLLRSKGEVLYDADGRLLVLIGDYGYANTSFNRREYDGAAFLEPLKGRRMWFPSSRTDQPGAAPLQRAYTQIVTPKGEVLHLNRFHDTPWAPVEVRCILKLMAEVKPRLVFDLHEYGGDDFWMSARRQQTDDDELWELRMAREAVEAVKGIGATFPDAGYSPGSFFKELEPGAYWLDPSQRGEGLNLVDFAARHYGPGFTIETGMRQDFAKRLTMHRTVVQTAVQLFEERFRAA
ncbi:twin-arginine translocation signal domain-containing protein [bacterium]|nr:twin-arginine translocation signal domain-containing protein [bacterium]